jgi:hypothetical protein
MPHMPYPFPPPAALSGVSVAVWGLSVVRAVGVWLKCWEAVFGGVGLDNLVTPRNY